MTDVMYFQSIRIRFINDTAGGHYKTDTVFGYENAFNASFSSSIIPVYTGCTSLKKGPVIAIRHMVTPSVSFSYSPYYGAPWLGYWRYIPNDTSRVQSTEIFNISERHLWGPPQYKAGVVNFSISNNLEMKVRNRKDTVTGLKKSY